MFSLCVMTALGSCLLCGTNLTVLVFISTLQLTALLLQSFHLRLHCYTLEATCFVKIPSLSF